MEHDIAILTARLLAHRWLARSEPLVRRALVDDLFRRELDRRLDELGLQLIDNPYAAHIAVALKPDMLEPVFGAQREYAASNLGLTRDEIALLVILWALLILPKRERQITRQTLDDDGQADMFGAERPLRHDGSVAGTLTEASLLADFGALLGGKSRVKNFMLGKLARLGFIERRNGILHEGPLLDIAIDYRILSERIIHGALADVLQHAGHPLPASTNTDTDKTNDIDDDADNLDPDSADAPR